MGTPSRGLRIIERITRERGNQTRERSDETVDRTWRCSTGRGATVPIVPIPRRYSTDAIVLSRFDYGEADRILTLITPAGGKVKAIAKGIRRPTSRLGGSLEPFAELHVALARGRTFEVVTEVRVGHAWLNLRDSLESAATAWYIAELADRSLEERHAAEAVYALLRRAYELLDAGMAPGRVARWYEMHLADELGVRPEVDRCVECDRVLEIDGRFRWVPPLGGVLCDRCPGPPHDRTGLTLEGLKLLKAYQRQDVEALAGLRLAVVTEREVESAMREFLRHALERDARSLAFLDEIRHEPGLPPPVVAVRPVVHPS
jgi:DNA repair protein RecO (recombination protein O)